jgi:Tol biopolymer transport system component
VFARKGTLVTRHFNTKTFDVSGPERVIADALGADATWRLGGFSLSADGRIAYQTAQALPAELAAFDRSGKLLGVVIGDRESEVLANPELSPTGLRVAVTLKVDNNVDVWLRDLQGGPLTRVTTDDDADAFSIWSPDATLIAFTANRTRQIHVKPSSGLGKEEVLVDTPSSGEDWSRDNRYVLYRTSDQKSLRDLWALDRFATPPARLPVATSSFDERNGQFSPDGRWVAYETNRSGPTEVVAQSFPDGERVVAVSRAGGTQPRWSADQQEIYFVAPGGNLMAASVSTTRDQSLQFGEPVTLFATRLGEGGATVFRPQYDVTPDGRFLIAQRAEQSASPLKLVLNWKPR